MPLKGELILVKNSNNTISIYVGDGTSVWSNCKCLNTVLQSKLVGKTLITAVSKTSESASSTSTVTDNGHSHNYTKTTGGSFTGTAHNHTITDNGHAHSYSKTTSASFTGTAGTTSSSTTGITASASAPSFAGSSHSHGVTDNKHTHGYDKVTSASFNGSAGTTSGSGTGITASASASSVSIAGHNHSIEDGGHTHGYDKVTSASFKGSSGETSGSGTGITAKLASAPIFTGTGHYHTYDTFKITYDKDETALKILTGTATTTNTAQGGTISTPAITITDPGHTHGFTPAGNVNLTYNSGTTTQVQTAKGYTSITINSASLSGTAAAQTITINDPGHAHGFTPGGSISLTYNKGGTTQTSTSSNASNISINAATQGGSVSAPTITITDKGHTDLLPQVALA